MLVPTPTVHLEARAHTSSSSSSSSASSSDYCSKHPNSSRCETPINENGLEIGLGVGIPVLLIMCVLGYFLIRNYRKDKKESLEHDPDFDEMGEATALPDFPAFSPEDPFSGSSQKKYIEHPQMRNQNASRNDLSKYSSRNIDEGFDGFVLPYLHQTGSKASLDEYADQVIKKSSLNQLQAPSRQASPTKRAPPRAEIETVGKLTKQDFTALANDSSTLVDDEFFNSRDHFGASQSSLVTTERFGIQYENEDESTEDEYQPDTTVEGAQYPSDADEIELAEDFSDTDDKPETQSASPIVLSPFEDHNELSTTHSATTRDTSASIGSKSERLGSPQKAYGLKKSPALPILDVYKPTDELHLEADHPEMSREQEEQLERMKSVYKVYFDRRSSVKSEAGERMSFQVDDTHPLPQLDTTHVKVNSHLKADTDYAKRYTAASSVYDATPIFDDRPNFSNGTPGSYQENAYGTYQHEPNQPPKPLAPLQSLPHASDFRNSSIETFTNYVPKARLVTASKYDSESSLTSPVTRHQPLFGSPGEDGLPALRKTSGESVPSATQLSRKSVVMLNPVSEIGPLRKYKPAGSLPSSSGSPSLPSGEWADSNDDLIPGNRKSAVRRMMNTNF